MIRKVSSTSRALAWAGALVLLVALLGWAIPRLALGKVFPAAPSFLNLFRQAPVAGEIAPAAEELGEGWILTAERSEVGGSPYFDLDPNGYPAIGMHRTDTGSLVDPEAIETVSMRGYAHVTEHWTLMVMVGVFKETGPAEAVARELLPNSGIDRDIPMEQYRITDVALGDEATMVSLIPPAEPPVSTLTFRKGRVLVLAVTLGSPDPAIPAAALSEDRLLEIGRLMESRIP